eukprot:5657918-Pleurochrysis_carterae.AAC.2
MLTTAGKTASTDLSTLSCLAMPLLSSCHHSDRIGPHRAAPAAVPFDSPQWSAPQRCKQSAHDRTRSHMTAPCVTACASSEFEHQRASLYVACQAPPDSPTPTFCCTMSASWPAFHALRLHSFALSHPTTSPLAVTMVNVEPG